MFVFDLSPDGPDCSHWDMASEGTTSLDINFGAPLPQGGIDVIIYAEFDSLIMIDNNREVYTDYTV